MKTILETPSMVSKFIIEDDITPIISDSCIELPNMIVYGLSSENTVIVENVIPPTDWVGNKYLYIDGWILNEEWVDQTYMDIETAKTTYLSDLANLRRELAVMITECRLLHDPEPAELSNIIASARAAYSVAKTEIDSLTEENYSTYVLRGPMVEQLLTALKSFL